LEKQVDGLTGQLADANAANDNLVAKVNAQQQTIDSWKGLKEQLQEKLQSFTTE
jgi:hypothetical protein